MEIKYYTTGPKWRKIDGYKGMLFIKEKDKLYYIGTLSKQLFEVPELIPLLVEITPNHIEKILKSYKPWETYSQVQLEFKKWFYRDLLS